MIHMLIVALGSDYLLYARIIPSDKQAMAVFNLLHKWNLEL